MRNLLKYLKGFRKKQILFLTDAPRGSWGMRALAIGDELERKGLAVNAKLFSEFTDRDIHQFSLFIFVKVYKSNIAERIKAYDPEKRIVFDPVDNFNWPSEDCDFSSEFIDLIFASSSAHKKYFEEKAPDKQTIVLQHHHSNFSRRTKNMTNICTIGYLGEPIQFEMDEEIQEYCRVRELNWSSVRPHSDEVVKEALKIDLGLIYLDWNKPEYKGSEKFTNPYENYALKYNFEIINFKPAQKLLLFLSCGIPVVSVPYVSYLDVVGSVAGAMEIFPFVTSPSEALEKLDLIREDESLRKELIQVGLEIAENYHISTVADRYRDVFNSTGKEKLLQMNSI